MFSNQFRCVHPFEKCIIKNKHSAQTLHGQWRDMRPTSPRSRIYICLHDFCVQLFITIVPFGSSKRSMIVSGSYLSIWSRFLGNMEDDDACALSINECVCVCMCLLPIRNDKRWISFIANTHTVCVCTHCDYWATGEETNARYHPARMAHTNSCV